MVELRWVISEDRTFPTHVQTVRTLQYRVKDDSSGHNEDPDWGEWMDVPETRL